MSVQGDRGMSLAGLGHTGLMAGSVGLLLLAAGWFFSPHEIFRSYLVAFLFWLGISLGSLAVLMLQNMVGGGWGLVIRRILEAAVATLPWMALLFVPLILGIQELYEWSRPEAIAHDPVLAHKSLYLNVPFFLLRAAVYFLVWTILGRLLLRLSDRQDRVNDVGLVRSLQRISGPGLVLYGATVTFASIDWGMSLEPHWFSTIYGFIFIVGQALSALLFAVLVLSRLKQREPLASVVSSGHFHDLGNLTLAFVMLWAYMAFSQYLITWSGNLPEEIPWYLRRSHGGWQYLAIALVVLHFAVPFVLLLSRRTKKHAQRLVGVALLLLFFRYVDLFWLIVPATNHDSGLSLLWTDVAAFVGIGGVWLCLFTRALRSRPLLPVHDPRLLEFQSGPEVGEHV